jgi:penicillin amidase
MAPRARGLGWLPGVLAGLSLILAAAFDSVHSLQAGQDAGTLRQQARAALAQTSGELRLADLEQPVDVIRDRWGIPHIYARTVHDLFFAQGFVAAQDRLWQLDLWRRIEEGKLSELLGPAGLRRDTFARLLRYHGDWAEEWRGYGPNARQIAEAFVAGINAQIDLVTAQPAKLPLEFQLTGSRPEHWTPEVVVGRMAGYVMTRNARTEVQRARIVRGVGAARAAELTPTDPPVALSVPSGLDLNDITDNILDLATGTSESVDFTPLRKAADASPARLASLLGLAWRPDAGAHRAPQRGSRAADPAGRALLQEADRSGESAYPLDEVVVGSNNWVVSGRLTASKKPLLANDPHRALMLPSLRYTVHLNGPGWNVIGAGEPALPGVAAGHNDRIAFGFTIVGMDQQDLYVEQLDPANPDRYLYKGRWETMRVERERVKVRGEADREVELRFTRHGPVLHVDPARHRAYALRWVGSEPGAAGYLRSLTLDTAKSVQDFRAAVAGWKVPSENIVYADVDGNIAWIAAGLAPIRRNWNGLLPVPGHTGEYEWDGFLKAEALPQLLNPRSGFIATANHNILPPGYPHALGYEFGAPWRFARIVEVLQERIQSNAAAPGGRADVGKSRASAGGFAVADFERLQHDEVSIPARAITRALAKAMREPGAAARTDADAQLAAKLLAGWDGLLDKRSGAAALYEIWLPLVAGAFAQAFAPAADREAAGGRMSVDRVLDLIGQAGWTPQPQVACWVDGTRRTKAGGGGREADEGLRAKVSDVLTGPALGEAWRQMIKRQGTDPGKWAWGEMHRASFEHPLAFTTDRQAFMNLPPVARGGDGTTPNATGAGARQTAGASYREVIDLSNWDASVTINVPGESGQPESAHYGNLLPLWAEGKYHPLAFSRAAVERVAAERLRLVPARRTQR